jgi:hypothetical protein
MESYRRSRKRLFLLLAQEKEDFKADTLTYWVRQLIIMAYRDYPDEVAILHRVLHETRAIASSWALFNNVPMSSLLKAAEWKSHNVFTNNYLRDLSHIQDDMLRLGPTVVGQHKVTCRPKWFRSKLPILRPGTFPWNIGVLRILDTGVSIDGVGHFILLHSSHEVKVPSSSFIRHPDFSVLAGLGAAAFCHFGRYSVWEHLWTAAHRIRSGQTLGFVYKYSILNNHWTEYVPHLPVCRYILCAGSSAHLVLSDRPVCHNILVRISKLQSF